MTKEIIPLLPKRLTRGVRISYLLELLASRTHQPIGSTRADVDSLFNIVNKQTGKLFRSVDNNYKAYR